MLQGVAMCFTRARARRRRLATHWIGNGSKGDLGECLGVREATWRGILFSLCEYDSKFQSCCHVTVTRKLLSDSMCLYCLRNLLSYDSTSKLLSSQYVLDSMYCQTDSLNLDSKADKYIRIKHSIFVE